MVAKTDEVATLFNLPEGDWVIQDYHAGIWRGLPYGWWQGRLFLCAHHILFRPTVGDYTVDVRLHDVQGDAHRTDQEEKGFALLLLLTPLLQTLHAAARSFSSTQR